MAESAAAAAAATSPQQAEPQAAPLRQPSPGWEASGHGLDPMFAFIHWFFQKCATKNTDFPQIAHHCITDESCQ